MKVERTICVTNVTNYLSQAQQNTFNFDKCNKAYPFPRVVQRHTNSVHESRKDYKCHSCDKSFFWRDTLKKHVHILYMKVKRTIIVTNVINFQSIEFEDTYPYSSWRCYRFINVNHVANLFFRSSIYIQFMKVKRLQLCQM